ncbi:MAG: thermonuclease family protein [Candidatus Omnitrophica bacterium]|nr:thermonuclease family protein [Candidatus Omnitrophota bacterium]
MAKRRTKKKEKVESEFPFGTVMFFLLVGAGIYAAVKYYPQWKDQPAAVNAKRYIGETFAAAQKRFKEITVEETSPAEPMVQPEKAIPLNEDRPIASGTGKPFSVRVDSKIRVSIDSSEKFKVDRVLAGNMFRLTDGRVIRLLGVKTAESSRTPQALADARAANRRVEYLIAEGRAAQDFTKSLLEGNEVILQIAAPSALRRGPLGAYVFIPMNQLARIPEYKIRNGLLLFVNEEIVRQGYAIPDPDDRDKKYQGLFEQKYQEARQAKRGIWKGLVKN